MPVYTQFAGQALELTTIFAAFVGFIPSGSGPFVVELTKPHGPSTGGGVQAMQHITFTQGEVTFVAGTLDPVAHTIELRDYDNLGAQFHARWHKPLPFDRPAFDAFITRLGAFATNSKFAIVMKPKEPGTPSPGSSGISPKLLLGAVVVLAVVIAILAWRFH